MKSLLKLLPKLLLSAGDSDEAREQSVFAAWAVAAGEHVSRATAPIRLERKTLLVAVANSTWRTQLTSIKGQLLFRVNSSLGSALVTGIEFVINEDLLRSAHKTPQEITFVASDELVQPLLERASAIPTPALRAAFLRAAGKCLERRAR